MFMSVTMNVEKMRDDPQCPMPKGTETRSAHGGSSLSALDRSTPASLGSSSVIAQVWGIYRTTAPPGV
ncbi:Uncharacterized protein HZ326_1643 [Fusarium oxysporum f. sp. albedinis]|nr:Uncharacterized protein HZ326_1643 [Fusarium oxysporum f. sp. albedinis]